MLKRAIRRMVSPAMKAAISRHVRIGSDPYGGAAPAALAGGASDFFLARGGAYESRFIAENTLAIVNGRHLPCRHVFHLFGADGKPIGRREVTDDRFNTVVAFGDAEIGGQFCGFIHQVLYDEADPSIVRPAIFHQHRGYTGFRHKADPEAVFANVHGNFGGLFQDERGRIDTFAVLRAEHSYSTQFSYRPGYRYEFFFLNPSRSTLRIDMVAVGDDRRQQAIGSALVPPFGAVRFDHEGADRHVFWRSALPVCRPIIFEHPANGGGFDVFHG